MSNPPQLPPSKPTAKPSDWICSQCNFIGPWIERTRGSFAIELLLWLFFCLPGLIYSVWRLSSKEKVCCVCSSTAIYPANSPRGYQVAQIVHPAPAPTSKDDSFGMMVAYFFIALAVSLLLLFAYQAGCTKQETPETTVEETP